MEGETAVFYVSRANAYCCLAREKDFAPDWKIENYFYFFDILIKTILIRFALKDFIYFF